MRLDIKNEKRGFSFCFVPDLQYLCKLNDDKPQTMKVKIHHEGENILLMLFLIIVASSALAYQFFDYKPVAWGLIVLMGILFLLVLNFFRLPRRHFNGENDDGTAVLSSVDGKVVALEEVYEDEYLHRNVIQLSVFMTVFNVHANWVPVKGQVTYVKHHSGRFLAANLPKSSVRLSSYAPAQARKSLSGRLQELLHAAS